MRRRRPRSTSELLNSTANLPLHGPREGRKRGHSLAPVCECRGGQNRDEWIGGKRPADGIFISLTAAAAVWICGPPVGIGPTPATGTKPRGALRRGSAQSHGGRG